MFLRKLTADEDGQRPCWKMTILFVHNHVLHDHVEDNYPVCRGQTSCVQGTNMLCVGGTNKTLLTD